LALVDSALVAEHKGEREEFSYLTILPRPFPVLDHYEPCPFAR